MTPMLWRTACVVLLAGGFLASPSSAQSSSAPDNFRLEITANFIAQTGSWVSSKAFNDEGTLEDVQLGGNGATRSVHETLQGTQGTFTLEITKALTPIPGDTTGAINRGNWRILDGTGAYSGITGQGSLNGTINFLTGEIHDTCTGHVSFVPQSNDAFQFRIVE